MYMKFTRSIALSSALTLGWLASAGCDLADTGAPPATAPASQPSSVVTSNTYAGEKIMKTEEEWKKTLTDEQFRVMRKQGTEPPFRNAYHDNHEPGVYRCAACGLELFNSDAKYDSGTGWPSFFQPIEPTHVATSTDHDLGYERTEVHCPRCGGHLGHVFDDGPPPTGLRYCMNSASLKFDPAGNNDKAEKP